VPLRVFTSRWVRLLSSLLLLAIVVRIADWHAISKVLRNADLVWVACAAGLALIDRLLLNFRWQLLLVARGLKVRFVGLFRVQLAANLLGSFLPSSFGLDAIRIAALCRAGLPAADVIAATLVDRATMVLATLMFGSAMVLALAGARLSEDVRWLILLTTAAAVIVCGAFLHPAVRRWLKVHLLPRLPARIGDLARDVGIASLAYRHQYGRIAWVAAVTGVVFLVRILFAKALASACGADVAIVDLLLVIPILWIVVMVPITVGNIGLQDAGYVALMALIGVPAAIAASMSLIEHIVARAVILPGIFFLADVAGVQSRPSR